jgi:hypothetical protein
MKRIIILYPLAMALLCAGYGCKKNQPGGKSVLHGQVKHHEKVIPGSRVFIKYNASEFPGTDTLKYDAKVTTGADGTYSFDLYKGSYFLFGYGYDPGVPGVVTGGIKYQLRNNEEKLLDVAVSEE